MTNTQALEALRDTGFHRLDADFTRGRGLALSRAEGVARSSTWRDRPATLITQSKEAGNE